MVFHMRISGLEFPDKLVDVVEHNRMDRLLIGLVYRGSYQYKSDLFLLGYQCQLLILLPDFFISSLVDGFCSIDNGRDRPQVPVGQTVLDVEFHISQRITFLQLLTVVPEA